jgi:hypothetical protein
MPPPALPPYATSEHAVLAARAAAMPHDQLAANHASATINLTDCMDDLASCRAWMNDHRAELMGPVGMGFIAALTGVAVSTAYAHLPHGYALGTAITSAVVTGAAAMWVRKHPELRNALLGSFCGSVGAISALESASLQTQWMAKSPKS